LSFLEVSALIGHAHPPKFLNVDLSFVESHFEELNAISSVLSSSLSEYHNFPSSFSFFAGNEEKIYLWYVLECLKKRQLSFPTSVKVHRLSDSVLLLSAEHQTYRQRHPLRAFLSYHKRNISCRYSYLSTTFFKKRAIIPYSSVYITSTVTHISSWPILHHLTSAHLSQLFLASPDLSFRRRFYDILFSYLRDQALCEIISNSFPTSHLEYYSTLRDHSLASIKLCESLYTNIYSLMDDPLLSLNISLTNPTLYYVQHGGSYNFFDSQLHHLEKQGCAKFLSWGVSNYGIKQTRYIKSSIIRPMPKLIFVMSVYATYQDVMMLQLLANKLMKMSSFTQLSWSIALHQNSPLRFNSPNIQYGVPHDVHLNASLIVYDNISHTLLWHRLEQSLPFYVLDLSFTLAPQSIEAYRFISILKASGLFLNLSQLENRLFHNTTIYGAPFRVPPNHMNPIFSWYRTLPSLDEFIARDQAVLT